MGTGNGVIISVPLGATNSGKIYSDERYLRLFVSYAVRALLYKKNPSGFSAFRAFPTGSCGDGELLLGCRVARGFFLLGFVGVHLQLQ